MVYDLHDFKLIDQIDLPNIKLPQHLVGCCHNEACYISDLKGPYIHKVQIKDNKVKQWKLKDNLLPFGLSVTPATNLLVTVWIRDSDGESVVIELSSNGIKMREIYFDPSVEWASQTAQLSNDHFIVCHGFKLPELHRVCVVTPKGEIIKSYGGMMGADVANLSEPNSVAIDNTYKRIFVADTGNDRIIVLDFELAYLGEVDTSRSIKRPSHVYLGNNSQMLIVLEENSSKPLILVKFELKLNHSRDNFELNLAEKH